jgi:hypothetical protein
MRSLIFVTATGLCLTFVACTTHTTEEQQEPAKETVIIKEVEKPVAKEQPKEEDKVKVDVNNDGVDVNVGKKGTDVNVNVGKKGSEPK